MKRTGVAETMPREEYEILHNYAGVTLPLDVYSLYEMFAEEQMRNAQEYEDILDTVIKGIRGEQADLYGARKELTERMKEIMFYLDEYSVFEYILARISGRFSKEETPEIDVSAEVASLVGSIRALKDKSLVQTNVVMITSQLPVRFTKQKFADIVSENLKIYSGLPRQSAKDFYENTLSYAGIYSGELSADRFADLASTAGKLTGADYANLSEDEYNRLKEEYNEASDIIRETIDVFDRLAKIINSLIVINETADYKTKETEEVNSGLSSMYREVCNALENEDASLVGEDTVECFTIIEGRVEKYAALKAKAESNHSARYEKHRGDADAEKENNLFMLLSESLFAELYDESEDASFVEDNMAPADDVYIHELSRKFEEAFRKQAEGESRMLVRARMAGALGQMLPIFDDINEFRTFAETTLLNTGDRAEREGSILQIRHLFES